MATQGHHHEIESAAQIDEYLRERLDNTDLELEDILDGNSHWVDETNAKHPDFFAKIGKGQKPHYLYIGCSDARVDPTIMMALNYGELFIHRNVGGVVASTDMNFLACLEYAVNRLKVPHIVVCGHYDCGAARGAHSQEDLGPSTIENWLMNIRDVRRLHKEELDAIEDQEEKHRRFIELHVAEQCTNILKTGIVQRSRHTTMKETKGAVALPRVHGLVFDPAVGRLKKIEIPSFDAHKGIFSIHRRSSIAIEMPAPPAQPKKAAAATSAPTQSNSKNGASETTTAAPKAQAAPKQSTGEGAKKKKKGGNKKK